MPTQQAGKMIDQRRGRGVSFDQVAVSPPTLRNDAVLDGKFHIGTASPFAPRALVVSGPMSNSPV
jgi:hypothetical protein